jgi:hypothetical protein
MSSKVWWVIGTIIILALLGLLYNGMRGGMFNPTPSPSPTPLAAITPSPTPEAMQGVLVDLDEQNDSSQSGTARLREEGGKVIVTLDLEGGRFTAPQPAHIHTGACPKPGAVKYPLTNLTNGESETTLDVSLAQLMSELPLAINVHRSAAQQTIYTACGDISATPSASPSVR